MQYYKQYHVLSLIIWVKIFYRQKELWDKKFLNTNDIDSFDVGMCSLVPTRLVMILGN